MSARLSFALISMVAACGGDGGNGDNNMIDSPPAATIAAVDPCPATADATITTLATRFDPAMVTITQGQVVKIMSTATHPVGPLGATPAILAVPEGQTKCFRFTSPGSFMFKCNTHSYVGTVTVN
jgi:plastocyanin